MLLSIAFIMVTIEDYCTGIVSFASLIAVMCMGISLQKNRACVAKRRGVRLRINMNKAS